MSRILQLRTTPMNGKREKDQNPIELVWYLRSSIIDQRSALTSIWWAYWVENGLHHTRTDQFRRSSLFQYSNTSVVSASCNDHGRIVDQVSIIEQKGCIPLCAPWAIWCLANNSLSEDLNFRDIFVCEQIQVISIRLVYHTYFAKQSNNTCRFGLEK